MTPTARVLVTGGCGYLGSQLIRDLAEERFGPQCTIRVIDNLQRGGHQALMNLPKNGRYEVFEGDILDPSMLRTALRDVDVVVHLAAVVQTPLSFGDPNWVEQVNHWGTSHLVEACLDHGVEDFIFASSAAVYGPGGPFAEGDACQPVGAYAHSKYQAEQSIMSGARRGLKPTLLRMGTLYGKAPVMRFESVANKFAYLAGVERTLTIYGEGMQKRPLIHVSDASKAICWTLRNREKASGEVFNVHERNVSVLEIAESIQRGRPDVQKRFTEQDIRTHLSFETDGSKIRDRGWQPTVLIEKGLRELVNQFDGFVPPVALGTHELPE